MTTGKGYPTRSHTRFGCFLVDDSRDAFEKGFEVGQPPACLTWEAADSCDLSFPDSVSHGLRNDDRFGPALACQFPGSSLISNPVIDGSDKKSGLPPMMSPVPPRPLTSLPPSMVTGPRKMVPPEPRLT